MENPRLARLAAAILLVLALGAAGCGQAASDRAAKGGGSTAATPDPADAARVKATNLAADGRYADAVAVLEAAGLQGQAKRVARRGAQALYGRARRALAAGHLSRARGIAADARDLRGSKAIAALIATANEKIAAARAAAILARDQRTCSAAEKATVRAGGGVPAGCTAFAAQLAAQREKEQAQAATPQCDPNYEGACLKPDSPDYDCEGGSGDGPDYTGTVEVVGDDVYDLDRDGDGIACDA
jgi:hypothetical protein